MVEETKMENGRLWLPLIPPDFNREICFRVRATLQGYDRWLDA